MSKRTDLIADNFRKQVYQMLSTGKSISAIAKATGKSYSHTKLIARQLSKSNIEGK